MSVSSFWPTQIDETTLSRACQRKKSKKTLTQGSGPKLAANLSDDWSFIFSLIKSSGAPEMTISDIVWHLQKAGYQTVSIEPIFRKNLIQNFIERLNKLQQTYQYPHYPTYSKIDIVFHGTPTKNVPSIIQQGFLIPHPFDSEIEGEHVSEHGQKWGPGIYFTKCLDLAALYGDGESIIMGAVAMGRQFRFRDAAPRKVPGLRKGFDSHVSADCREGAAFREGQIVPLCVIRVKETEGFEWFETEEYVRAEDEEIEELLCERLYKYQQYRGDTKTY